MASVADRALVLGLGGNLGGDAAIIERMRHARDALSSWGTVVTSPVYRTAAIGPAQPDYLNAALAIAMNDAADRLPPHAIIDRVLAVENELGRVRSSSDQRFAARTIDIDVLLWGQRIVHEASLRIPHPRLVQRRFALAPLIELLGEDVIVPGDGRSLMDCWDALRREKQIVELTTLSID